MSHLIGIGEKGGRSVHLLVYATKSNGDWIDFSVINGAWDGRLYVDGTMLVKDAPGGDFHVTNRAVLFNANIPGVSSDNYNEAMFQIDRRLQASFGRRALFQLCDVTLTHIAKVKRFRNRLSKVFKAMRDTWNGVTPDIYNDQIPF